MKGNSAGTIHKIFYNIYKTSSGAFGFKLKNKLASIIKLIVIDECSMLNDKFIEDILSFGLPTIFLGDIGQLPPIIGRNSLLENTKNIDAQLTKVMRQNDESGILDLATMSRNNQDLPIGTYKKSRVLYLKDLEPDIEKYDVILCWKNSTRKLFNKAVRERMKIKDKYPLKGEKIIITKNSYYHQIEYEGVPIFPVNGMRCYVLEDYKIVKDGLLKLKYRPDFIPENGPYFETLVYPDYFNTYEEDIEKDPVIIEDNDIVQADFGYSLSVHKSQGSGFGFCLLLDEMTPTRPEYFKYMYTGLTRGINSVDVIKEFKR